MNGQAIKPATYHSVSFYLYLFQEDHIIGASYIPLTSCPTPHQHAIKVKTHCLLDGRYSRKTVVSNTKFPPAPKAEAHTKNPRDALLGDAPATIAKVEQMKREVLNAVRRPMISAPNPQKIAPRSIPR